MRKRSPQVTWLLFTLILLSKLAALPGLADTVTWTNSSGGSWTNPANWSAGRVPSNADEVVVSGPNSYMVMLDASVAVSRLILGSPGSQQTLSLNGTNLTLTIASNGQFLGGTLSGAGTLIVNGSFHWAGGRMVGPGTTRVSTNATLVIVASNTPVRLEGRRLDNAGTNLWESGGITTDADATITNRLNAAFLVRSAGAFTGSGTFRNLGFFCKRAGLNTLTLTGTFNNRGTCEVQAGTLNLTGGGLHTGSFVVTSGAKLAFVAVAPKTHDLKSTAASVSGPGSVAFNGIGSPVPTIEFNGLYNVGGRTTFGVGVTNNFNPGSIVANLGTNVTISGGAVYFNSGSDSVATDLNLVDLNLSAGVLGGSNTVTVTGLMRWLNSTVRGPGIINASNQLDINFDSSSSIISHEPVWLDNRTLNTWGATRWMAGQITTTNGSGIHNQAGATWDLAFAGTQTNTLGGSGMFYNAGRFTKSVGENRVVIGDSFVSTGFVDVRQGTLEFADYLQEGGTNLLNGGSLAATQPLQIRGGLLQGAGTIYGSVSNGAVIHLGDNIGTLNVSGDFTQAGTGTMEIDLHRLQNLNNWMAVTGAFTLNGTLNIGVTNSYSVLGSRTNFFLVGGTNQGVSPSLVSYPTNLVQIRIDEGPTSASIVITNTPPWFTSDIPSQTIDEGPDYTNDLALHLEDAETPSNLLDWRIVSIEVSSPTGSSTVGSLPGLALSGGRLTWALDECQAPSTNIISLRVCDPTYCVATNFTLVINEVNQSPVWSGIPIPLSTLTEGTSFTDVLGRFAYDPDCPTNVLRFDLVSVANTVPGTNLISLADPNLSFNRTTGEINWTPNECQGPGTYLFTVEMWDTNQYALANRELAATTNFSIVVTEANQPPVWTNVPPTLQTFTEVTVVTNSLAEYANDPDCPTNVLRFGLIAVTNTVPGTNTISLTDPNLFFGTNTGELTWTPDECQGPGTYVFTVTVWDTNLYAEANGEISATTNFTLVVTESNRPPVWTTVPPPWTVDDGATFATNLAQYAYDPDCPTNLLRYELIAITNDRPGSVPLATNDPSLLFNNDTGDLVWIPNQCSGTYLFTVTVWDTNQYALANRELAATTNFTIVVNEVNQPPVWTGVLSPLQTIPEGSVFTRNLAQYAYDADCPTNVLRFGLIAVTNTVPGTDTISISDPNLSFDTNTGVMIWAPDECQGPGTYVFTVTVWDTNLYAGVDNELAAMTNFTLVLTEANRPPVWTAVPPPWTIDEGALFATNLAQYAYDPDCPTNLLRYELIAITNDRPGSVPLATNDPSLSFNPTTGDLVWTANQCSGTYLFSVRVWDTNQFASANKELSTTTNFTLVVNEVNQPPVWTSSIPDRTFPEGVENAINLARYARDPDCPTNVLNFAVVQIIISDGKPNSPRTNTTLRQDMTFTNGVLIYTPRPNHGPSTNLMTVEVWDTNAYASVNWQLTNTTSFTIFVTEANLPPVWINLPAPWAVAENTTFNTNLVQYVFDPDDPTNELTFALVSVVTTRPYTNTISTNTTLGGLSLNTNGVLTWDLVEGRGPSTNVLEVRVSDTNSIATTNKVLSATNRFTLVVNEVNQPPTVSNIPSRRVNVGSNVTFAVSANDADVPPNLLSFRLTNAPAAASIDANGRFSWTPTVADGSNHYTITVIVTDTNEYAINAKQLSTNTTFDLDVNPAIPVLSARLLSSNVVSFALQGPAYSNYVIQTLTNLTSVLLVTNLVSTNWTYPSSNWIGLITSNQAMTPFGFTHTNSTGTTNQLYRARMGP